MVIHPEKSICFPRRHREDLGFARAPSRTPGKGQILPEALKTGAPLRGPCPSQMVNIKESIRLVDSTSLSVT